MSQNATAGALLTLRAEPREVVVHGSANGFAQEVGGRRPPADCRRAGCGRRHRHGVNPYDLLLAALGILYLDDRGALRASQTVPARGRQGAAATREDPRSRLRGLRDDGRDARF